MKSGSPFLPVVLLASFVCDVANAGVIDGRVSAGPVVLGDSALDREFRRAMARMDHELARMLGPAELDCTSPFPTGGVEVCAARIGGASSEDGQETNDLD